MFRRRGDQLQVLLAHPGGPLFRNKNDGVWTIPKGEIDPGEDLLRRAGIEFEEEVSELNDLRCLEAAEGYIELGMYDEADAEIAKVNPTCRIFRLFVCAKLVSSHG